MVKVAGWGKNGHVFATMAGLGDSWGLTFQARTVRILSKIEADMSRFPLIIAVAVLLSACGGREFSAPRNLDDACAMQSERPKYFRGHAGYRAPLGCAGCRFRQPLSMPKAALSAMRKPRCATHWVLSRWGVKAPQWGIVRRWTGTWDEYRRETGNRRADRTDIRDATDFVGWYSNKSRERNGIALNDARNLYLAYHDGAYRVFARQLQLQALVVAGGGPRGQPCGHV